MHSLHQKDGDWGASVMVTLGRHGQKCTGMHHSLEEQGHGPREMRCCGSGPAAYCLYWLEDPIIQQDLHKTHHGNVFHTGAAQICVSWLEKVSPPLFFPNTSHRVLSRQSLTSIFHLGVILFNFSSSFFPLKKTNTYQEGKAFGFYFFRSPVAKKGTSASNFLLFFFFFFPELWYVIFLLWRRAPLIL